MAKKTFNNLSTERQKEIQQIMLPIFTDKPISQIKVSEIVMALGMSRGIFYKYFEDLHDAYRTTVSYYAGQIHREIMMTILQNQTDFFSGIESFLVQYTDLEPESEKSRQLQLLTENSSLYSRRSAEPHGAKAWQQILKANHFKIDSEPEITSFLYFAMHLVIETLIDTHVNHWHETEMLADWRFKVKWLTSGLLSS